MVTPCHMRTVFYTIGALHEKRITAANTLATKKLHRGGVSIFYYDYSVS